MLIHSVRYFQRLILNSAAYHKYNQIEAEPEKTLDMEAKDEEQYRKVGKILKRKHETGEPRRLPDLVTFLAKLQIYRLHQSNPLTYDLNFMVQHFPTMAGTYSVGIYMRKQPVARTFQDIKNHDELVLTHWEELLKGTYDEYPTYMINKIKNKLNPLHKLEAGNGKLNLPFNFPEIFKNNPQETFIKQPPNFVELVEASYYGEIGKRNISLAKNFKNKQLNSTNDIYKNIDNNKGSLTTYKDNKNLKNISQTHKNQNLLSILPPGTVEAYIANKYDNQAQLLAQTRSQLLRHNENLALRFKDLWVRAIKVQKVQD